MVLALRAQRSTQSPASGGLCAAVDRLSQMGDASPSHLNLAPHQEPLPAFRQNRLVLAAVAHVPPAMLRGSLISRHPIRPRRLRARLVVPAPHCRQRVQHVGPVNQARCDQRGAGLGGTVGGPDQVFAPIVHQDPRTDGEGQAELLGADRNATTPASVLVSQMPRPAWPNAAACAAIAEGWQAPSSS